MNKFLVFTLLTISTAMLNVGAAAVVDDVLNSYKAEGGSNFNARNGEALWKKDFPDPKSPGKVRNCSTCHGTNMNIAGKHVKTGKKIDPIAPSANPERLTDAKFIAKWFKRNCKWVLGRECTAQEKGDVLMYLRTK